MTNKNYVTVEVELHKDHLEAIDQCQSIPPKRLRLAAQNSPRVTAETDSTSLAFLLEGAITTFSDAPSQ